MRPPTRIPSPSARPEFTEASAPPGAHAGEPDAVPHAAHAPARARPDGPAPRPYNPYAALAALADPPPDPDPDPDRDQSRGRRRRPGPGEPHPPADPDPGGHDRNPHPHPHRTTGHESRHDYATDRAGDAYGPRGHGEHREDPEHAPAAEPAPGPEPGPFAWADGGPLGLGGQLGLRSDDEDDDEPWSPPNHRRAKRGRGRFAAVPLTAKLLIGVVVCALVLTLADRCAVLYAEREAAERLRADLDLAAAPEVEIHGFPFLTQVARQRVDRVDVTVPDVPAGRVSLARVHATAEDIELSGDSPAAIDGALIGALRGDVLLSFDDLGRELGASQVRYRKLDDNAVRADGTVPVAGQMLRVRADARLQRDGGRGVSTQISNMLLDIPEVASYRPGPDAGLRLHREAAERIVRDAAKARALLSVPAIADRIGVPQRRVDQALRSDARLTELVGAPRFVQLLMGVNLVDVVRDHPWLLEKLGLDPKLLTALTALRLPELSERLALSFQLPEQARDVRLRDVVVRADGIHAQLTGNGLPFGAARER
ncbi:LmeA family phospholipid-binding protein [Streptomyces buecherae]|uniref:LmeA family phospholipid-binding protein n=2 Tax=Streptomyces buecherae TaxID=2763006 RepID=UPI00164D2F3D|nr:DUF2993 domain-containing protein [Streptomyces buecherae]QNJ41719.1 DUF2993 domain-containing protein [Streptomyces buecherae]